jgi:hypothetical protein
MEEAGHSFHSVGRPPQSSTASHAKGDKVFDEQSLSASSENLMRQSPLNGARLFYSNQILFCADVMPNLL